MSPHDAARDGVYGTFPRATPPPRSVLSQRAPWLSRLFFLWVEYLVDITKTRRVRDDDVWQLDPEDRSAATYDLFMGRMKRPREFMGVMARLYWPMLLRSAGLSLLASIGGFLNPLLLFVVIDAAMNDQTSPRLVIAALMLRHFVKILSELAVQHSQYISSIVATRTIGALQTLLFDTTISSTWSRDVTVSEASNLFYELTSVHHVLFHVNEVWLSPLSLLANLGLLYYILGDAVYGSVLAALVLLVVAYIFRKSNKHIAKQLLKYQGRRLQIMGECFKTIQTIKLHAWEQRFLTKVRVQRNKERRVSRIMAVMDAVWRSILIVLPELVLTGSFAAVVSMHNRPGFNPAMAFASLAILYRAKNHMGNIVWLTYLVATASAALKQVLKFLETSAREKRGTLKEPVPNTDLIASSPDNEKPDCTCVVRIKNAAIGRSADEPLIVMANLFVPAGALVVVHGSTGAGKSSLLEALVDSALVINPPRGSAHVRGRVAYCSQNPWLQSLSIRDNILFGEPYDENKYLNVLHACCLLRDIGGLPRGDMTVIGPKGLTLSGGQKARIALARACYADADVYLLDAPLASVDAIVQGDIFRRCIVDLLKYKTVLLVTHNMEITASPIVDQVVFIDNHRLVCQREPPRRARPQAYVSNRVSLTSQVTRRKTNPPLASAAVPSGIGKNLILMDTTGTRIERVWRRIEMKGTTEEKLREGGLDQESKLMPLDAAFGYLKLCGGITGFAVPLLFLYGLSRGAMIAAHLWICKWSEEVEENDTGGDGMYNIEVLLALLGACSIFSLCGSLFAVIRTGAAANTLFDRMARAVLFAPMSFFYDQPIGEIMNRFSGEVRALDEHMDRMTIEFVFTLVGVIAPWLVIAWYLPETIVVAPLVSWLTWKSRFQMKIALEMIGLVVTSFSPCFEAISEAVDGRHVIQAFGAPQVARFRHEHHCNLDKLLRMMDAEAVMRNWGVLQFLVVDTLLLAVVIGAVAIHHDTFSPAIFGLALNYVVTINYNMFYLHLTGLDISSDSLKIHHFCEYGSIPPEQDVNDVNVRSNRVSYYWPSSGEVVFHDVSFEYDKSGGPVIRNINLRITPGEKIGLVGRTGAGKSSLTMALFRIHDLVAGRILVDGVDIAMIDLHTLRSRLSIIPQSPLFFKGSLRSYLDPFDEFDDVMLWEALRKTGLADVVSRMEGKLAAELHENAENISQGERQLLCLSRVLLKQSKVVVLDEATAAIDQDSDESLQSVLQREFSGVTVISIAHRLESIMQFDRVVVMDDGRIVQCGTIEDLVADATGPFFDLLEGALLKM